MDPIVFAVGQQYANGQWDYEVLELKGPHMLVRSADGQIRTLEVATAARLWDAVQAKAEKAPSRRKRAAP